MTLSAPALVALLRDHSAGLSMDAHHLYHWSCARREWWIPSVTQILRRHGYAADPNEWAAEALDRGDRVHRAIAERRRPECADGDIYGFVASCDAALGAEGWRLVAMEIPVQGPPCERTGRPLCAGTIDAVLTRDGSNRVPDWKTGPHQKWHQLQTAGYSWIIAKILSAAGQSATWERGVYELHADGSPATWIPHDDPVDLVEWEMNIRRLRRDRGPLYWSPWPDLVEGIEARQAMEPEPDPFDRLRPTAHRLAYPYGQDEHERTAEWTPPWEDA